MKIFSCLLFLGLLIGRNLPFNQVLFYGLGPWDLIAMGFGILLLFTKNKLVGVSKRIVSLSMLFIFTSFAGLLANMYVGSSINDIFEILRILYCLMLVRIGSIFAKYLTKKSIKLILFLSGIIVFLVAYNNPMNPDVLGFVQIWNPNVIGNVLVLHVLLILLISDSAPDVIDQFYAVILLIASFFTYSKATWLLILIIMLFLILRQSKKVKIGLILSSVFIVWYFGGQLKEIGDSVAILVESKINASGFNKNAAQGSSIGARYGLALSGLLMFFRNPILGVGIGNFETMNLRLSKNLDEHFYMDDNANSLIFHYLGTTGLFGAISVLWIIYIFYQKVTRKAPRLLRLLFLFYIVVSINFQRELFTSNTMWLFIGINSYLIRQENDSSTGSRLQTKS